MSVYTRVERDELEAFLQHYSVGPLTDYEGISAGIENTNYFVNTNEGQYVLTLFEWLGFDELPYFMDLTAHLADDGVPCPHPIADNDQQFLRELNGKPAALVTRLAGHNIEQPNSKQAQEVGRHLGHMHVSGQSFTGTRDNERGSGWWQDTLQRLRPVMPVEQLNLLEGEIRHQSTYDTSGLPAGVIHADLFRDNVLFTDNRLTGMIDFYYACNDLLLYDLAVTVNDWCSTSDGALDQTLAQDMLSTYDSKRPLSEKEHARWPDMLRAAALRFWLSRLQDKYFPRDGEITHIKDPDVFMRILIHRINHGPDILNLWIRH